jgi:phosphoserine phosphatase
MDTRIRPMMTPSRRRWSRHLESGAIVAIVTATNSFVTGPIARAFGIPHLVATVPAQENGAFTGKPRGTPAFKAARSSASRPGSKASACAGRASKRAASTATPTTTCR